MDKRALIIGHFSTVGDIEVLNQVEGHLSARSIPYDVASYMPWIATKTKGWVQIAEVDAASYSHLLVVCGPLHRPYLKRRQVDLDRFAHCVRIGINLSMIEKLDDWNPFDALLERDSDRCQKPDLSFLELVPKVPVVGLCLVEKQGEYGDRQRHQQAAALLRGLAKRAELAIVEVDTQWPRPRNASGFSSPSQFELICARLDVMLTTRLHGTVLSLKNGVPVIAIDAISGGGKLTRQSQAIGWPEVYSVDTVTDEVLDTALERCLSPDARDRATKCALIARQRLSNFSVEFDKALDARPLGKPSLIDSDILPQASKAGLKNIWRQIFYLR